jgi:hypothetical protein
VLASHLEPYDWQRLTESVEGLSRFTVTVGHQLDAIQAATSQLDYPQIVNSTSIALENTRKVASGACRLWGFSGTNTNASTQFILAFDSEKIPSNGAVPSFVMQAPASDNFWVSWVPSFRQFDRGCVICNSSTAATLTLGAADCWFDAQWST